MHEQEDWRIKRFKNAKLKYWEYSWEEMIKWEKKKHAYQCLYIAPI